MKAYNMCACILRIHCAYVSFGNHPTIRPVATAVANMPHDIPMMMLLLLMMITMVAMVVLMQVMMMVVIRVMAVCGDDDDGDEHSRKSYQLAMT